MRAITADHDELVARAVADVPVRRGFGTFVEALGERGDRLVVLSSGFHQLIGPILAAGGIDTGELEVHANDVAFGGWRSGHLARDVAGARSAASTASAARWMRCGATASTWHTSVTASPTAVERRQQTRCSRARGLHASSTTSACPTPGSTTSTRSWRPCLLLRHEAPELNQDHQPSRDA